MKVILQNHTPDIIKSLYLSYRIDYSSDKPSEIVYPTEEKMLEFIEKRFETGHLSPLYQIHLYFTVEGISRVCSHQLVRHTVGTDFEQQSQRYASVDMADGIVPPKIAKNKASEIVFKDIGYMTSDLTFKGLVARDGIEQEDARYILPGGAPTNIKISMNYAALQHFCDLRTCHAAQWEIRELANRMIVEVRKNPETKFLGKFLGPKCMLYRQMYCDESRAQYNKCPISKHVPHRSDIIEFAEVFKHKTR